jgi:hypothetical protein
MLFHLLATNDGKEHVECNLNGVDKDQTMFGRDEFEVHRVDDWPNLPGTLTGGEQILFDFVGNHGERVAVAQAQICKEYSHKDGAPNDLIKGNLHGNLFGFGTLNLLVEPVVKEMSRWSMIQETKGG